MKRTEKRLSDRLIALLLSVVMVFSMVPAMSAAAAVASKVADPSTMDSWKDFFDPLNPDTEHAGGVWTDKSVFASVDANSVFEDAGISLADPTENFLVVLSALAANSVLTGQNSTPTDVVFVLDISGSMNNSGFMDDMVSAANESIRTLLASNPHNRVGVVLYSDEVHELLPLDRYTGVTVNGQQQYLMLRNGAIYAGARVYNRTQYITNSAGKSMQGSVTTGGGTYIQGGLWKGYELFDAAKNTLTGAYAKQVPVLVLLSDGSPTYVSTDYNDVDETDYTDGAGSSSYAGDGLLTQLTASYVKDRVRDIYNNAGASDTAYFYTLGLGLDQIDNDRDKAIAKAVLDPVGSAYTDITNLWDIYRNLNAGGVMDIAVGYRGTYSTGVTTATITADKSITNVAYVDKYFPAAQASSLSAAFQNIVNEINLKSGYYPTHLDDGGSNYSGYVTFVDELGNGMRVEQIEGIMIGEDLFTGKLLAEAMYITDLIVNHGADPDNYSPDQYLHDGNESTTLGDNVAWAIGQRLDISNTEAQSVLSEAWADGQIRYDPATGEFSNYISWFGDVDGNYLGFCDKDEAERVVPAGAVRINYCYEMLGATAAGQTHNVADMMYVVVQVSTEIATGKQMVVFRVPSSLLPVVTYSIDIDSDTIETSTEFKVTYNGADPIRLVYEVGLREEVTELNYADYAKKIGNKYFLYTNSWDLQSGNSLTNDYTKNNYTYAYFEPGEYNEHYYFTEDTLVVDANGDPVTSIAPGGTYYFEHHSFKATAGDLISGTTNQFEAEHDHHYGVLSAEAIAAAQQNRGDDGYYYVPKGFMHHNLHSHDLYKNENDAPAGEYFVAGGDNVTETFHMVRQQFLTEVGVSSTSSADHYELIYLGNNGRLEVVPATGLALTKYVDSTISDPNAIYTFEITFIGVPAGTYNGVTVTDDGNGGTKATVQLKAGQTVYIYDLPSGATYFVEEVYSDLHTPNNSLTQNASGVILADDIIYAAFTNTSRGTGNLIIEKDVTNHPFTTEQIQTKKFRFDVTLTRENGTPYTEQIHYMDQSGAANTADAVGGVYSFYLSDNESLTVLGLPAGVTYTVVEESVAGFKPLNNEYDKTGTIVADQSAFAHFINEYVSAPVTVQFEVSIMKELHGDPMANPETFEFHVDMLENGQYQCDTATKMTITGAGWGEIAVSKEISKIGVYDFRIHEVAGSTPGMSYDGEHSYLRVHVTDNDMDGQLEYSFGDRVNLTGSLGQPGIYGAAFHNTYDVEGTTAIVKVHKNLENDTGVDIPLTNFHVGLFTDETCNDRVTINGSYYFTFDVLGDLEVHLPVEFDATLADGQSKVITYYLKELAWLTDGIRGLTFDTTIYKVDITVKRNGSAMETVSVAMSTYSGNSSPDGNVAVFNNTYTVNPVDVTLSGEKFINGRDWLDEDRFYVDLYITDASFEVPAGASPYTAVEVNKDHKTYSFAYDEVNDLFDALHFTKVGIYHFVVKETGGGDTYNGMYYDDAEYHVTVTVTLDTSDATAQIDNLVADVQVLKVGGGTVTADSINFTNTYTAKPAEVYINGLKEINVITPNSLAVISPAGYEFTLLEGTTPLQTVVSDADGEFRFDALYFHSVGTYYYTVQETGDAGLVINGVSHDAEDQTFTVNVTDNGRGQLLAEIVGSNVSPDGVAWKQVEFRNSYSAEPAQLALTARKHVEGKFMMPGEFTFRMVGINNAPMPLSAVNNQVTANNIAGGLITFDEIEFTVPGEYKYEISEVTQPDGTNGFDYDDTVYTVTVTVEDNGLGQLVANVTAVDIEGTPADEVEFVNIYSTIPAKVTLSGKKIIENLMAGSNKVFALDGYEFILSGEDYTDSEVSDVNGAFVFDTLTFDKSGEYVFKVTESGYGNKVNGVSYNAAEWEIVISVKDDGLGHMVATVNGFDANDFTNVYTVSHDFTNTYSAEGVDVILHGNKVLQNITPTLGGITLGNMTLVGGEFEFVITGHGLGAEGLRVVNDAQGNFSFALPKFTAVGQYNYTITEQAGNKAYIGYTAPAVNVTVNVTDNGMGQLVATVGTVAANEYVAEFVNTYSAEGTSLALTGLKDLDGRDLKAGEFEFTLTGLNGAPMPAQSTVSNDADGKILFGDIFFDKVGVYHYTVEEVRQADGTNGITYDKAKYNITVTVTDNGDGTTKAVAVSKKEGADEPSDVVFYNKYQSAPAEFWFGGTKVLNGRDLRNGEFTFLLKDEDGDVIRTATNNGRFFEFDVVELLEAGTYVFTIEEDSSNPLGGVTYDKTSHKITVVVKDDGLGRLFAYVDDRPVESASVVFTNTYAVKSTSLLLTGLKKLNGRDLQVGEFEFVLTGLDNAPMPRGEVNGVYTAKNSLGGSIVFPTIEFTAPGVYKYTVEEAVKPDGTNGITYDKSKYLVTVTVTDNGDGTMTATKSVTLDGSADETELVFTNTYKTGTANVVFGGDKTLNGRVMIDGEFKFLLKDENGKVIGTATNKDGKFAFDAVEFTNAGTYVFYIEEDASDPVPGVTYDKTSHKITVVVTDDGLGNLIASVNGKATGSVSIAFTNTYKTGTANVVFGGDKTLNGRVMIDGEFMFLLKDENGKVIGTATNKDGKFAFDAVEFTNAGTYVFYIEEDATNPVPGVTYDKTSHKITVVVTDDGLGNLIASVNGKATNSVSVAFTNTYKTGTANVVFGGDKILNGRVMIDGEFKFLLKDENGKVIGTATNKDGKFAFDAVEFTKAGTYVFYIEEDATDPVPGVTYDKTSHKITVVVTDDGLGNLIASVNGKTANTANVKFTNTFTPDDVRVPIMIQKILENKTGTKIGLDGFRFILTDGKDFTQELVSDKDGKAGLTLTFGPEDAGKTFTFYLSEEDMGATGMTYDEMVYEIKIAITRDEVTGELTASVTRDGKTATDAATFTNTYFVEEPPKTSDPMNLEMVVGFTAFCATASTMMLAVLLLTDRKARKKVDK